VTSFLCSILIFSDSKDKLLNEVGCWGKLSFCGVDRE
jgi:hypothetical protein